MALIFSTALLIRAANTNSTYETFVARTSSNLEETLVLVLVDKGYGAGTGARTEDDQKIDKWRYYLSSVAPKT